MAATTAKAAAPIPPNQTLYVTNLPSAKIQKDDLKTALYMLFSTYGPILDVVALKTMKMRGQAHIVYRDLQAATQAMRSLEGAEFLGRELVSPPTTLASPWLKNRDSTYADSALCAPLRGYNMQSQSPTRLPSSMARTRYPAQPPPRRK